MDHRHLTRLSRLIVAILLAGTLGSASGQVTDTRAAALPLSGVIIAIDPGHDGGNASHAAQIAKTVFIGNGRKACNTVGTSTVSGYSEHRFTFAVALRVKARLEALGATVYLTRSTDTGVGPCVDVRGKFGAKVHAQLMVSIHGDGSSSSHRGFFVMKPGLVRGYTDDILASLGHACHVHPNGSAAGRAAGGELLREERAGDPDGPRDAEHVGRPGRHGRAREHEEQHRRRPDEAGERSGSLRGRSRRRDPRSSSASRRGATGRVLRSEGRVRDLEVAPGHGGQSGGLDR